MKGLLGDLFAGKLLNLRAQRQDILAANIANASTPGYKANRFQFEEELRASLSRKGELSMARTDRKHLPVSSVGEVRGTVQPVESATPKKDGNTVDLEQEMARQSANQILYNYAAQSVSGKIQKLRMVIEGGR